MEVVYKNIKKMGRRKSTILREEKARQEKEAKKAAEKVAEIEALELKAQEEEANVIQTVGDEIKKLCESKDLYCGVKLTKGDVLNIVALSMDTKDEIIEIPFRLYFTNE